MANVLLVHGAWHGGWCWRSTAEALRREGHRVFTPSLTGLGDRAHLARPEIDLDLHIADIVAFIEAEELDRLVMAGHSYGGMVITGVADRLAERLAALVYVDAFLPNDGETVMQLLAPGRRAAFEALPPEVWQLPPVSAEAFGVRRAEDRAWVDRRCVGMPRRCFTQPAKVAGGWRKVPRLHYVLAGLYGKGPFMRYADRLRGDPRWHFTELPCGHEVMVDLPNELATTINEACQ